ncbi:MAG: hypothetical protein CHACPFDD_03542 [Phycisphaerae bacterium]|nr:hypothetical protein [Phycisphaerae bacterium]
MPRANILRACTALLLSLLSAGRSAAEFQVIIPPGSGIVRTGLLPNGPSWIEHYPLENHVSFDVIFSTPAMELTCTGGQVEFFDAQGNPVEPPTFFTPAVLEQFARELRDGDDPQQPDPPEEIWIDGDGNAVIPIHSRILLPCPDEVLGHNVLAASARIDLFLDGFATPLSFLGIEIVEYRPPAGDTYLFGLGEPLVAGGVYRVGNAHDLGSAHRTAFNQRYAYDVGIRVDGDGCDPCDENDGHFIYGQPVIALAAGSIVVNETGHPENSPPGTKQPGIGDCLPERCDGTTSDPCVVPSDGIPGGGNMVCIEHDNGEWSFYAHFITGSNDFRTCNENVVQGDAIGEAGNSGSSGGPHLHFQTVDHPSPDDSGAQALPIYFTNVSFTSPGQLFPRRQLEVGITSGSTFTVLPAFDPPPPNEAVDGDEVEPNHTLALHNSLSLPASVGATLEHAIVGDLAIRGDGIEDVFRFELPGPDEVRIELSCFSGGQNLDVYVLTEDLRVLNPTGGGTTPIAGARERLWLNLDGGAYFIAVTNVDSTRSAATDYRLTVARAADFVYVDQANSGCEDGTFEHPFNTVQEGLAVLRDDSILSIEAADYDESGTTRFDKRGWVVATNGTVRIH